MLTLRLHNHKTLSACWPALLGILLLLGTLGFVAGHSHWTAGSAPAPAYVSQTSSLIGTADGTLLEGSGAVADPPASPAFSALPVLVVALGSLGAAALLLPRLYTHLCRRLNVS